MRDHDGHIHVTEEEASGGSKEGVVRWVLVVGLLLAVGLLSVTWIVGAWSQDEVESQADVSGQISAMEGEGGDSAAEGSAAAGTAPANVGATPEPAN